MRSVAVLSERFDTPPPLWKPVRESTRTLSFASHDNAALVVAWTRDTSCSSDACGGRGAALLLVRVALVSAACGGRGCPAQAGAAVKQPQNALSWRRPPATLRRRAVHRQSGPVPDREEKNKTTEEGPVRRRQAKGVLHERRADGPRGARDCIIGSKKKCTTAEDLRVPGRGGGA